MNIELNNMLNQQVANFSVLFEKLHHLHWFVKGPQFFTLHEKFQEDYEEITEYVDEIAERLIMVGGRPLSSMKEYLEVTTLKEIPSAKRIGANEMVKLLIEDYKQLCIELKQGIELAGEAEDSVTEDLFIGILTAFDKKVWVYTSFTE